MEMNIFMRKSPSVDKSAMKLTTNKLEFVLPLHRLPLIHVTRVTVSVGASHTVPLLSSYLLCVVLGKS
jgi:hypothetical protein